MGILNDFEKYTDNDCRGRGRAGIDGIGFKLTDKGNYDIDGKRLTDLSKPVDGTDAATKAYVDEKTSHNTSNLYHLRQSFEFYDSSGTKLALSTDNITGLLSDYKYGYYKIAKGGDESTYSYVYFKIKNTLPQSKYSALFYLYGYKNNSIMTGNDLGPVLYGVDGTNYSNIKYDDDDEASKTKNHVKGVIWFNADGDGSMNIELRFFDKSITHFVVLSRCVEGIVNLGFNVDIFNVAHNSSGTFYFEDINMNGREIKNLGDPADNADATNKSYVDGEIAKVNIDTTPLLPRNGSRSMFGDLDMDGNHILSVKNLVDYKDVDPYEYRVKDLKSVVNKEYLNENFLKKVDKDGIEYYDLKGNIIKNCEPYYDGLFSNDTDIVSKAYVDKVVSNVSGNLTTFLPLDGSKPMIGNIDMGGFTIKNVKPFVEDDSSQAASDAQRNEIINYGYFKDERGELKRLINKVSSDNVKYVNDTIENKIKDSEERSIQSVQQENVFKKVMTDNLFKEDDRIEFLSTINYNLLHRINHQTYLFRIKKDPPDSYNCRLSIDLRYLPTGTYTMVFEMKFFPQIDHDKVSVNATSSSLNQVSTKTRVIKFDYGYYSRSIINFNKSFTNPNIDDLDINLHLSLKDSVSPKPDKTPINVIVYGVRGTHSDIPIQTWDKLYDINNSILEFEVPINMNGKAITNLKDPINDQDAATKQYVDNNNNKIIHQENAFLKVMDESLFILDDDDIHQIGVVNKDFYEHNKKTYHFQIDYDSSIGYYSTRLGINVVYLPISHYTIVFEMYFSDKINKDEITIGAASGTLQVNNTNTIVSTNNTRSIINFNKLQIEPSDDELEIDIALKNKHGQSIYQKTDIYVIVYGVYGTQNDIDKRLWDRYLYIDNNKINFEAPVNMGNRKITGVADATDDNDVVNKSQLDVLSKYYYFTNDLKHSNSNSINFSKKINKYPFLTENLSIIIYADTFIIQLLGYYQIIYNDYYNGNGIFKINKIFEDSDGYMRREEIYSISLHSQTNYTPITINTVININSFVNINKKYSELNFKYISSNGKLLGAGYSSFYIRYLHP